MTGQMFMKYDFYSPEHNAIREQQNVLATADEYVNDIYNDDLITMSFFSDSEPSFYVLMLGINDHHDNLEDAVDEYIQIAGKPNGGFGSKNVIKHIQNKYYKK